MAGESTLQKLLAGEFVPIPEMVAAHAAHSPDRLAFICGKDSIDFAAFDARCSAVAAALQRDGVGSGDRVVTIGKLSIEHVVLFLGALRAGVAVAPLPQGAHPEQLARMVADVEPTHVFADEAPSFVLPDPAPRVIGLDAQAFSGWIGDARDPRAVAITPDRAFNIIYSSGTTGTPKGVVQPHQHRWRQVARGLENGFDPQTVALVATPMCSNTTLTILFSALGAGGMCVLMPKFDAGEYLRLAENYRSTHTALVPVQFQRILRHADFAATDLSSFRIKITTGSPMSRDLKAQVVARWPGVIQEYYGMTEGGLFALLDSGLHADKLHTVGKAPPGFELAVIDPAGNLLPPGETGEIIGHSAAMMTGYFRQPEKTAEIEWFDPHGRRWFRSGDLGRIDADGFLELSGRAKEMIISGGFNIHPRDLEDVIARHPDVAEVAVAGVPSEDWGETPVAWVVPLPGSRADANAISAWANERLSRTQRLGDLLLVDELPRNTLGKVVKGDLTSAYKASVGRG